MTTNTSHSTHNDTSHEDWMPVPASQCIPWVVVFITECLTIVIHNIITIIVFVKQRQLQRRSTYLIIHLAIVDLLAGAFSGPLIFTAEIWLFCDLWDLNDGRFKTWVSVVTGILTSFPVSSLFNLAFISLERLHATFRPYKHRFIKKWVYGVIITVFWIMTVGMVAVITQSLFLSIISISDLLIWYIAYHFIPLFVIVVSYVCIFIKVRCSRHPQHHGAAGRRERKLTSTLLLVTLGSLLTWLPHVIYWCLLSFEVLIHLNISFQWTFPIVMTLHVLYFANSLLNPIIYALRMPELRAGLSQLFRRNPNRQSNPVDLPLQNL